MNVCNRLRALKTENEIICRLDHIQNDMSSFYQQCPYYRSSIIGENISVSEYIVQFMWKKGLIKENNGIYLIDGIIVDSIDDYCRNIREDRQVQRDIEIKFQRDLFFKRKKIKHAELVGEIFIWFELASNAGNGKGIDLISFNEEKQRLTIYELKYGCNCNEHVLKAILEIQTYYQRTKFNQFKEDWERHKNEQPYNIFKDLGKLEFNSIRKVILIDENIKNIDEKEYPLIKDLINRFGIIPIYFKCTDISDIV